MAADTARRASWEGKPCLGSLGALTAFRVYMGVEGLTVYGG